MEIIAVATAILAALVSLSAFRFQRFTLSIARGLDEANDPRTVSALQQSMTPAWIRRLDYVGYLLGIAAIVLGSPSFGWAWGIAIIAALLFGRALVVGFWPVPSTPQCVTIARNEAMRRWADSGSERDQVTGRTYDALIAELERVHTS